MTESDGEINRTCAPRKGLFHVSLYLISYIQALIWSRNRDMKFSIGRLPDFSVNGAVRCRDGAGDAIKVAQMGFYRKACITRLQRAYANNIPEHVNSG